MRTTNYYFHWHNKGLRHIMRVMSSIRCSYDVFTESTYKVFISIHGLHKVNFEGLRIVIFNDTIRVLKTYKMRYLHIFYKKKVTSPSILEPNLDLRFGELQTPRKVRSLGAREVLLRGESSLEFINLGMRESRPAALFSALGALTVRLGLEHVFFHVIWKKKSPAFANISSLRGSFRERQGQIDETVPRAFDVSFKH